MLRLPLLLLNNTIENIGPYQRCFVPVWTTTYKILILQELILIQHSEIEILSALYQHVVPFLQATELPCETSLPHLTSKLLPIQETPVLLTIQIETKLPIPETQNREYKTTYGNTTLTRCWKPTRYANSPGHMRTNRCSLHSWAPDTEPAFGLHIITREIASLSAFPTPQSIVC